MTSHAHDPSTQLVKMANDIADYFRSEPDRAIAIDGIANHLMRFWEPRMRRKIVAHYSTRQGEGLSELACAAIARLAEKSGTPQ